MVTCPWSAPTTPSAPRHCGMHARDANPKAGRWCCTGRAAASRSRRICKSFNTGHHRHIPSARYGLAAFMYLTAHSRCILRRILITTANSHQAREHHQLPACDEPAGLCAPTADPGHVRPLRHYRQWGITGYRVGSAGWHAPPAHQGWFRTKRECQVALNEAITALRSGTLVQPARRMMASFPVEECLPAVRASVPAELDVGGRSLGYCLPVTTASAREVAPKAAGAVLLTLCAAQFLMALDSSVMNVSIATVAEDLGTTITGIQTAIVLYTLVMAMLMVTGGKVGSIIGRKRAFMIGCVIYCSGSLTTALSPNLGWLIFGWSFLEGVGAALIMPAIVALVAGNFPPAGRPRGYGLVGAAGAIAVAVGPLIGGLATTYASWRVVFAGEVLVGAGILVLARRVADAPSDSRPHLDWLGSVLWAAAMGFVIIAVLRSSEWGWVLPAEGAPSILGCRWSCGLCWPGSRSCCCSCGTCSVLRLAEPTRSSPQGYSPTGR